MDCLQRFFTGIIYKCETIEKSAVLWSSVLHAQHILIEHKSIGQSINVQKEKQIQL